MLSRRNLLGAGAVLAVGHSTGTSSAASTTPAPASSGSAPQTIPNQGNGFGNDRQKDKIDNKSVVEEGRHVPTNGALSSTTVQLRTMAKDTQAR